jgi:hypothetical protein
MCGFPKNWSKRGVAKGFTATECTQTEPVYFQGGKELSTGPGNNSIELPRNMDAESPTKFEG